MAKKKLTYLDLLTKLSPIFPRDLYIMNNKFIVSGNVGEEITPGRNVVILYPDYTEIVSEILDPSKIYYISDLKKYKSHIKEGIMDSCCIWEVRNWTVNGSEDSEKVKDRIMNLIDDVLSITEWDTFNFTDKEVDLLFDKRESIKIFDDAPTIISKSIFPSINKKDISKVCYHRYEPKDRIAKFVLVYDRDMFQSFFIYTYIIL